MELHLILVLMVLLKVTEEAITTQISREASLLKTLESGHILVARGIKPHLYNYWNKKLQQMELMFIVLMVENG